MRYEIEQGIESRSIYVNHESIYQHIYDTAQKGEKLWEYLRYGKKRRTKKQGRRSQRIIIPGRVWIDERPSDVEEREEIGHYESDTIMYGKQ
ncbi:MAG: hypothetical protein ACOCXQ_01925 [Patescibacteria group bacterium]